MLAIQQMEKSCWDMAVEINVDLSRKPHPLSRAGCSRGGAWVSFVGSFQKKVSALRTSIDWLDQHSPL